MPTPPPTPPSKKDVMLALLERAEARVHLDARKPGVELPPRFLDQAHLRLDYGYGFSPPIPDLVIDDAGIRATLSFNRQPFATFVPWSAVFLIADFEGNGAVWQEDVPADLQTAAAPESNKPARTLQSVPLDAAPAPAASPTTPAAAPAPAASPTTPAAAPAPAARDEDTSEPPEPEPPKPRGSHLKLVK